MDEKVKVEPYKPPTGCRTLVELTGAPGKIEAEAAASGHDGFMPVQVVVPGSNGKPTVRGQAKRAAPYQEAGDKGRSFLFWPTKEMVTIVREKVGKAYSGDWIHEVISREGKKFLASVSQLRAK
jgi:hypothetical protein